jgi:hypothetical protein
MLPPDRVVARPSRGEKGLPLIGFARIRGEAVTAARDDAGDRTGSARASGSHVYVEDPLPLR